MGESSRANFVGELLETFSFRELFVDNREPAEPLAFIGIGPQGGVFGPEALDLVVQLPVFERSLHGLGQWWGQFVGHRFAEVPVASFACFSTAPRSLSKASAKSFTPSSVSWSVTSFMEIPARARSSMVL